MKRYKSSIIALIASTVFIGSSLTINAYLNDANLKLSRIADNKNNILLQIEDVDNMVKAFSLSLSLEDATLNNIDWSSNIQSNAKATLIENDDNTIDIYVTSNEDLVNEEGNLEIGKINVNGNVGDNFNVSLNENKKSIKLVTKNNKEIVSNNVEIVGDKDFTISEVKVPDNNGNINDSVEDKPTVDTPSEDKPTEDKPTQDNKPSEDVPSEDKPIENEPSEDKPEEDKPIVDDLNNNKPSIDNSTTDKPSVDNPSKDDSINNEEAYKPEDNTEEVSNPEKVEEISTPNNKQEITNEVMEDSNDNLVLENVELDNNNSKTGDNSLIRIFLLIGCGISSMLVALITIYNKLSYKGKH